MLTLFFRKPMKGGKLTDDMPDRWQIKSFTCPPLAPGQAPPAEGMVANFELALVDANGEPIGAETLRQYDLKKGLGDALRAAWA